MTEQALAKIDAAFEKLNSVLDASGSLEASATRRAAYELRLEIVRAIGDDDRIRAAEAMIAEDDEAEIKVFEVTAAGFDASTDETDDLVFWVTASSSDIVREVIADTGANFCGDVAGCSLNDVDFRLPSQSLLLTSALLEKASVYRNLNRIQ